MNFNEHFEFNGIIPISNSKSKQILKPSQSKPSESCSGHTKLDTTSLKDKLTGTKLKHLSKKHKCRELKEYNPVNLTIASILFSIKKHILINNKNHHIQSLYITVTDHIYQSKHS